MAWSFMGQAGQKRAAHTDSCSCRRLRSVIGVQCSLFRLGSSAFTALSVDCSDLLSMRNTYADIRAQSESQIPPIVIKHAKRACNRKRGRLRQRGREREWEEDGGVGVRETLLAAGQVS